MPQGYFNDVEREMVRAGFAHISTVPINSMECEYHVPALVARATSLFFHKHGKGFIVMLRYYENIEATDTPRVGNWRMDFYIRFKTFRVLLTENPQWLDDPFCENGLYRDMPILGSTRLEIRGFTHFGGMSMERDTENEQVGLHLEEPYAKTDVLSAKDLAGKVLRAFTILEKYLDRGPIFKPSLSNFVPHYTFSGQDNRTLPWKTEKLEETFWSKFDWDYFRHLVIRPWGYTFRRRQYAD